MRGVPFGLAVMLVAVVAAGCAAAVLPASNGTLVPTTAMDPALVFYARAEEAPLGIPTLVPSGASVETRIRARFTALATGPALGPGGSFNLLVSPKARVAGVQVASDIAQIDFAVASDDWGLADSADVRALLQQVVFTVTDESSIDKVLLTRNEGAPAVIAMPAVIVTYHSPLTREIVAPIFRPEHAVAYFARDGDRPLAVYLYGAGVGATAEERIRSRLLALEDGPFDVPPDAYNALPDANARLEGVRVDGDLVTIDYDVPGGDWGVDGTTRIRAFLQQLVFTASEEPGITRVLMTQNGGRMAIIGGEGLIVDRPASRSDVSRP